MKKKNTIYKYLPVLLGFFVMGLVDLVGISTNYVKKDFVLSDTLSNLLPMSLFLWFSVLSIPTGLIANKIGRKRTVILSMAISFIAMILPLFVYNFPAILIAFSLLGIGNTIIQVSLNPLVSDVVSDNKLASSLTLGQFVKAIAAFLGPIIAGWAAINLGNWKYVFLIFGIITLLSGFWLQMTKIEEKSVAQKTSSFSGTFKLLNDRIILMLFVGILFVVGVDVGLNTTIPKFLMAQVDIPLEQAGLGTSLYFVARTVGTFIGAILLVKLSRRKFFFWSMFVAIPTLIVMLLTPNLWVILTMIFIVGFSVANVFSIIFSAALQRMPERANEISGLLITGVAGGAIFPFLMGIVSDSWGQTAGMALLLVALGYLIVCAFNMKEGKNKF
ncbi:MAG: MFS transporter [Petrimonas sp.]|jgi:fucose permease